MNKRQACLMLIALMCLGGFAAWAGPKGSPLAKIKERYKEATQLEEFEGGHHDVVLSTMLPALGLRQTRIQFVFSSSQKDPERDPYLLEHELYKVVLAYNVAARQMHRAEYLFDSLGHLVFFLQSIQEGESTSTTRCYFHDGKLFRVIESQKSVSGQENRQVITNGFGRETQTLVKKALVKSKDYKAFFLGMLKLEKLN